MANETNRTISIYLNNSPAIKKLNELEGVFNKEKRSLRNLTEGSKEWIDQLRKVDGAAKDLMNYRSKLDITGLSLKQLNNEAKNMRALRDNLAPGTAELKLLNTQLENVEKRMFSLRAKKDTGTWSSIKNIAIGSGIGNITGNLAQTAFNEALAIIPNAIKKNAELADSYADVMKYTGLTDAETKKLSADFKEFNTRTPREELLKLAGQAGTLNITGVANIRNFVKEADQLRVALGDDLGDDAVIMMAKLNNLWGTDKVYGYAQALTKAGSAVNSLAQAGVATGNYIVDATSRLGGMAAVMGITQSNVMGVTATMEELAITSELGTTAINMLWSDLYKNTANYAKIAKMNVKDFAKLLKNDANEAFLRVLQGLGGTNKGLETLVKNLKDSGIDGSRATAVFASLSKNVNLVREKQALANTEFTKGTSIANEFNTKNQNLAGSVEKIGKVLSSWYSNGIISKGVNALVFGFEKLIVTNKKVSEGIADQMTELTRYRMKINDTNIKEGERIKLINELKAIYPQLLKDIDAQTVSNTQLNAAIGKVNNSLLANLLIEKKKESLGDIFEAESDSATKFLDYQAKIQDKLAKLLVPDMDAIQKSWNTRVNGALPLYKEGIKDMQDNINKMINAGHGMDVGVLLQSAIDTKSIDKTKLQGDLKAYLMTYYRYQVDYLNAQSKSKGANASIERYKKQIENLLKIDLNPVQPDIAPPTDGGGGDIGGGTGTGTAKEPKQYATMVDQYKTLNATLLDLRIGYAARYQDVEHKELQDIRDKYRHILDDNTDLIIKLQKNRDEALQDEAKARLDGNTALADKIHQSAVDLQDSILLAEEQGHRISLQQEQDLANKIIELRRKKAKIESDENEKVSKEAQELIKKDLAARKEAEERIFLGTAGALQIEIYQMNKHYDELVALAKKYGMDTVAIENQRSNALSKIMRGQLADAINITEQMMSQLNNMVGYINQAMANRDSTDLQNYEKNQDKRKKKLADRLAIGFLTQEQYDAQVAALEEETAKRQAKIKQDAFKREQKASIIQAAINTALGVTRAYATMIDPISGSIMAALIAATGVAQIAAIAAQPVPEYAKGGYLLSNDLPSHAQGGLSVVDQYGNKHAEVEGGEGIIPRQYARRYKPLVDRMIRGESIGQLNGSSMPIRMSPTAMREAAEYAQSRQTDSAKGADLSISLNANTKAIQELMARVDKPSSHTNTTGGDGVKFVYTDWLRESKKFENIKEVTTLAYSKTK